MEGLIKLFCEVKRNKCV